MDEPSTPAMVEDDSADIGLSAVRRLKRSTVSEVYPGHAGPQFAIHHAVPERIGSQSVRAAGGLRTAESAGAGAVGRTGAGVGASATMALTIAPSETEAPVGIRIGHRLGDPAAGSLDGDVLRHGRAVLHKDFAGNIDGPGGIGPHSAAPGSQIRVCLDAGLSAAAGVGVPPIWAVR